jgi:hypothetical protein
MTGSTMASNGARRPSPRGLARWELTSVEQEFLHALGAAVV